MLRFIISRLALPAVLAASLLPAAALAQSQDSQSVADAARRARDQKKPQPKPAKVITDDDLKPATATNPSVVGTPASTNAPAAVAAPAPASSTTSTAGPAATAPAAGSAPAPAPSTAAAPNPANAPAAGSAPAPAAKDQKESKEVTELKAKVKKALDDLNLVLREQSLENDKYYSNPDYVHDTAGKAKIDDLVQQAIGKQQVLDQLKAHLAELLPPQDSSATAPPKP